MFKKLIIIIGLCTLSWCANYVFDEANIIPSDVQETLSQIITNWQTQTKHQMAIVTVKNLNNTTIEELAVTRFKQMGIGRKAENDGILFLIAPNERKLRIEVGYGLEQYLPDGLVGSIRDKYIIPFFKSGNFPQGILYGAQALLLYQAKAEGIELTQTQSLPTTQQTQTTQVKAADLIVFIIIVIIALTLLGKNSKNLGGGWLPWVILSMLLSSGRSNHYDNWGGGMGGFGGGSGFGGGFSGGGGASGSW